MLFCDNFAVKFSTSKKAGAKVYLVSKADSDTKITLEIKRKSVATKTFYSLYLHCIHNKKIHHS